MDDELLRELRAQTAILRIAFRHEIESVAAELRSDPLASAIIDALSESGSMRSGVLWADVRAAQANAVRRTFNRRLAALAEAGVVNRTGAGPSSTYELTGLIQ